MSDSHAQEERELLVRWMETWKRAGPELETIRQREMETLDTPDAVRQIFSATRIWNEGTPNESSGLVEQQAWFAKLRK